MTENKRIFLNILATYGRSLYSLLLGIFSARWVLTSLGQTDYGLFGLICGLTAFITFFNSILSAAISRYYSYSVGSARKTGNESAGLEECRVWFNTALSIHTVVPFFLVIIGYPIGVWAIKNWLVIPPERVHDCLWLFRFVCASCFVGMVNVPFGAMYHAKQYIAELTIYSVASTTVNFIFLCYMINHPGDWLVRFGLWTCCLSIVPSIIIAVRAFFVFPECRVVRKYLFLWSRFRQLGNYAIWQMLGTLSALLKNQGITLVINKFFGPRVNAAMAIGNSVNGHCASLASSLMGAFYPAIITAYGAGDTKRFLGLVMRSCKFGVVLAAIFSVPLFLELPEILRLWLKEPPQYTAGFAGFMLMIYLIENATSGHVAAVHATGKIARYQIYMGSISLLTLPIAILWVWLTDWAYGVCAAMVLTLVSYSILRIILTRQIAGVPIMVWVKCVFCPLVLLVSATMIVGASVRLIMDQCFIRIVLTTAVCEFVMLSLTWCALLDNEERAYVMQRLNERFPALKKIFRRGAHV